MSSLVREINKLRELATFGAVALINKQDLMGKNTWEVWEVDSTNHLRWCISEGYTPEGAVRESARRLRTRLLHEIEDKKGERNGKEIS